eukprot:4492776-Amphidinium_carterae.3
MEQKVTCRAGNLGILGMRFDVLRVPATHSSLEATLLAELLEKLPSWLHQQCRLLGALSSLSTVVLLTRSVLPLESHARLEGLRTIEKPQPSTHTYSEAVHSL